MLRGSASCVQFPAFARVERPYGVLVSIVLGFGYAGCSTIPSAEVVRTRSTKAQGCGCLIQILPLCVAAFCIVEALEQIRTHTYQHWNKKDNEASHRSEY